MIFVIDASVVLKWLFDNPEIEPLTEEATDLMQAVVNGSFQVVQPVHWLAEVAAVLSRKSSESAETDIRLLINMNLPVAANSELLLYASKLSIQLNHHLFDTLYHALAVKQDAVLVTADEHYYRKALSIGHIRWLGAWHKPQADN